METIKLVAQKRDAKTKARKLRGQSLIPAVVYGKGVANRSVVVDHNAFVKAYRTAGDSTLIDLDVEGDGVSKVLVKDIQIEPVTDHYNHIDFYQVNLKEKLHADIALEFKGEAPAIKELGGSLVKSLGHLRVECLPTDLVHEIAVDISVLKTFDDIIRVKDIALPNGIVVLDDPEAAVVAVEAPITEEQLKAMEAPATADVSAIKTEAEEKKAADEAAKAAEEAAKEAAK